MEGPEKTNQQAGMQARIPFPPHLTHEETDPSLFGVSGKPPPQNQQLTTPPPPQQQQQQRREEAPNGSLMYWMRIEDYATQIRIVALQGRCGNVQPVDVQKAHELAIKMQEELRPLLMAAQGYPNGQMKMGTPNNNMYSPISKQMNYSSTDSPTFSYLPQNFVDSNSPSQKPAKRQKRKRQQDETERSCKSCSTTETPEWRRGPLGPRTLCNACGLKWAKKLRSEKGSSGMDQADDDQSPGLVKKNTFVSESNVSPVMNNTSRSNSLPITSSLPIVPANLTSLQNPNMGMNINNNNDGSEPSTNVLINPNNNNNMNMNNNNGNNDNNNNNELNYENKADDDATGSDQSFDNENQANINSMEGLDNSNMMEGDAGAEMNDIALSQII